MIVDPCGQSSLWLMFVFRVTRPDSWLVYCFHVVRMAVKGWLLVVSGRVGWDCERLGSAFLAFRLAFRFAHFFGGDPQSHARARKPVGLTSVVRCSAVQHTRAQCAKWECRNCGVARSRVVRCSQSAADAQWDSRTDHSAVTRRRRRRRAGLLHFSFLLICTSASLLCDRAVWLVDSLSECDAAVHCAARPSGHSARGHKFH